MKLSAIFVANVANVAQLHDLKCSAYAGYDLAVTSRGFFDYKLIDNC